MHGLPLKIILTNVLILTYFQLANSILDDKYINEILAMLCCSTDYS